MNLSHRHYSDLIPWLINDRIAEDDRLSLEEHLQGCAECRADVEEQRRVYRTIAREPRIDYAPSASLQRLLSKIDIEDATATIKSGAGKRAFGRATHSRLTQWLAAAVVIEAIGLSILAGMFWRHSPSLDESEYRTVTTGISAAPRASLRVVFAPTMTLGALDALLQELRLEVVSGPSPAGVYTLALGYSGESLANELAALRARTDVRFAEPIVTRDTAH